MTSPPPRPRQTGAPRFPRVAAGMLVSAAAVLAYQYFGQVELHFFAQSMERHAEVISGTAASPYRYRVLVPFLANLVIAPLSRLMPARIAFLGVYGLYDFLALAFSLLALFAWLRRFSRDSVALIFSLYCAVLLLVSLRDHYFMPWSWIEPGLVAVALMLAQRGPEWRLIPLTAIATLNRETGLLVPALFAVARLGQGGESARRAWAWSLAGVATWAAVVLGLRWTLGSAPPLVHAADLLRGNLEPLRLLRAALNLLLFGGVLGPLAFIGFRRAPAMLRRATLVVPPYLAAFATWGVWHEMRLLAPLYPLLAALAACGFAPENDAAPGDTSP